MSASRYHGCSLAGAHCNLQNNRRQKQKPAYIRKELGTEYRNLHDAVWLNGWMMKSGENVSALLRNRIAALERLFAPEDFTGFFNPPSSQAQDHLPEAKRPGCCWWVRLDQVMCGMDGCAGQQVLAV
jgi:hypothetical protein